MKNIFRLLVFVLSIFLLTSCVIDDFSKKEELISFFNSHSTDITYEIHNEGESVEVFELNIRPDAILFETSDELLDQNKIMFMYDYINNNLFYDFGEKIIYTKLNNSNNVFTKNTNINRYIYNILEVKGNLFFDFSLYHYLNDNNIEVADFILSDYYVTFSTKFSDNKLVELSYEIDGIKAVIKIGGYIKNPNVTPESTGFKEIMFPSINDCLLFTEEELKTHLNYEASGDIDNYELIISDHDFEVINGQVVVKKCNGIIYDNTNSVTLRSIGLRNLYYNKEDILESEDGKFKVNIDCFGKTFSTEIQATVVPDEVFNQYKLIISSHNFEIYNYKLYGNTLSGYIYDTVNQTKIKDITINDVNYNEFEVFLEHEDTFIVSTKYYGATFTAEIKANKIKNAEFETVKNILTKLTYGFSIDNNIYLCDERYLYKFDPRSNELIGKIDLQSIGKSHYVKDDFLYITSYVPYENTYREDDEFVGYITKIKLTDFTIDKQTKVNCFPNSIIVDNRDNVLISKSANQQVYIDEVDMETGSLTPLIDSHAHDVLLYDSYNDVLLVIQYASGRSNEYYIYDGISWKLSGYNSQEHDVLLYTSNELLIFDNGIYHYDIATNNYVFHEIICSKIALNYYFKQQSATIDNEYVYILEYSSFNRINSLIVYNINTDNFNRYFIPIDNPVNFKFMYIVDDIIYCISDNGIIYKIIR